MKTQRVQKIDVSALPATYSQNSAREELLLDYAANFETTFLAQFPSRRPLFISPMNEARVAKFVPTFLKPTVLPDCELSSGYKIAQFVAATLDYEQLENACEPPKYVVSPQTALEWQRGDCFDYAILLASLLIGAGFNAFVCVGYADRRLTCQLCDMEDAPESPQMTALARHLSEYIAADAAVSSGFHSGLLRVPARYCRAVEDYNQVEQVFDEHSWITDRNRPVTKEIYNFWFRCNVLENEPEKLYVNIGIQHANQLKNDYGFSDYKLLEAVAECKVAEMRYTMSGDAGNFSDKLGTYGATLLLAPEGVDLSEIGGIFSNKYLKPRPVVPESQYAYTRKIRDKMSKIGASEIEIENYVLQQMQQQGTLDDILIPGQTGQKVKAEQQKAAKQKAYLEAQHLYELCIDNLENQRVHCWVYVCPNYDDKFGYQSYYEDNINVLIDYLKSPQDVRNGMFIDPPSGRVFSLKNKLFTGIESVFNNLNYFVNLQSTENQLQTTEYDFFYIESWCICLMTSQMVKIRYTQLQYINQKAVYEYLIVQTGGSQNEYLLELDNSKTGIHSGIDLPGRVVQHQEDLLDEQANKKFQYDLVNQNNDQAQEDVQLQQDLMALKRDELYKKYAKRWDSVTPARILITSLPSPWPVATSLPELKIQQNFPLRPRLFNEKVKVDYLPEKTMLYRDCFIRCFNEFSQRTGCVMILQTRPRPVYSYFVDHEGDVVLSELTGWRISRYYLFRHRLDCLSLSYCQFEVPNAQVEVELNQDQFLRNNFGGEVITKFDTEHAELNGKQYPIWCFIGQDTDEGSEDPYSRFSTTWGQYYASILFKRQYFEKGRGDRLKSHEMYENGMRKTIFYPNRDDQLACYLHLRNSQIEQRYYDFLRLDGLKRRMYTYSPAQHGYDLVELNISYYHDGCFENATVSCVDIQEEFRDLGSIQKTINSRRRRLVQGKYEILNAEQRYIAGISEKQEKEQDEQARDGEPAEEPEKAKPDDQQAKLAFLPNEDAILNQDTFAEIETALTLSAYNIYVAQKQIFATNIASINNPTYSIYYGAMSILSRHEDLLLMSCNLVADAKPEAQQDNEAQEQAFAEPAIGKRNFSQATDINKSYTESETSDADGESGVGIDFWLKKRTSLLVKEDSKKTTKHLKRDLQELFQQKAGMQLPKGLATNEPALNKLQNIDNELRKQPPSHFVGVWHDYFSLESTGSQFSLLDYLALLKKRELPILPMHDSSYLAYAYAAKHTQNPYRYQIINYMLDDEKIRVVEYQRGCFYSQVQRLFDKAAGVASFSTVFGHISDIYTRQLIVLGTKLRDAQQQSLQQQVQKSKIRQPLTQLNNQNLIFQSFQTVQLADQSQNPNTSVLKISEEFVQLSSREKLLHASILQEIQQKFETINAVEQCSESKLHDKSKQGLRFKPRDVTIAQDTLAKHGLEDRFALQLNPPQQEIVKIDGADYLAIFIPDEFKEYEVLPRDVAKKVLHDCMDAMRMRLVERSSIIYSRLEGETENLRRKKAVYNKSSDQLEISDREKILQEIRDSIFRIEILELRLQKHAEQSAQRYVELEHKIKADKRMTNWE